MFDILYTIIIQKYNKIIMADLKDTSTPETNGIDSKKVSGL